jgi:type II secretory pathway component PulK
VRNHEQGFALPMVMAVSVLLFLVGTLLIYQIKASRLSEQLYGEQLRGQYAAEGGIAMMQQQLHESASPAVIQLQIDGIEVKTEVITKDTSYIHVRSTAKARWGVQQTIQVQLAVKDLAIVHWFR